MGTKNLGDNSNKDLTNNPNNSDGLSNNINTSSLGKTIVNNNNEIIDPLAPYDDSYGLRNPNSEGEQPDATNSTKLAENAGNIIGSDGKNHNPDPTVDVSISDGLNKVKTTEKHYEILHTGIGGFPSGDMVLEGQVIPESGFQGVSIARLLDLKAIKEYKEV